MTTTPFLPARTAASRRTGPVIALLLISAFVVVLNETAMGVSIPRIMSDFGVSATSAQWLTTAFMLTMAVVIPTTGVLLRRLPLRRNFLTAMGVFTFGTLVAATAPTFDVLLVARVVQALGTAIMLPLLFTTVMQLVAPERRGRTMGLVTIVTAAAPALGPTFSGILVSASGWRSVFVAVLPVAAIALIAGAIWLRTVTPTAPARFDLGSLVLSAVGFSGLIYGLASIGERAGGEEGMPVWIPLTVGTLALAGLVWRQFALRDTDRVLLDPRVFTSLPFTLSTAAIVVVSIALFGSLILLPLFIQGVLGEPAYVAGLMLLPGGILSGVLAPFVGMAYDRVGPRILIVPGAVIVTAAMAAFSTLAADTPVWAVIAMHVLLSIGTALMVTPLMTTALGSVTPGLYSHASAIVNTLQQVSGAAGTALFITLFSVTVSSATSDDRLAALAGGVATAFGFGAAISLVGVFLTVFLRTPARPAP
ncbi:DHA2 family lincomycin resistance protein-like MFS transporter [Microbacterium sp. SLBN-154]|uniref:DHA2 family efflux MFS transporter permease subunit n=1 Tax=Microbacterium sp. SLBN-154 TaxID=2768458 RepID=UPI001153BA0E|nr:DHA2 family efflux MFS transporter permease subunit [Microbacterium sp. SLBN-154]TQK20601.1 DHA2 family lincomycin resistance protein-like MFS transporter [Microbacterium sp. SLBN-154]